MTKYLTPGVDKLRLRLMADLGYECRKIVDEL